MNNKGYKAILTYLLREKSGKLNLHANNEVFIFNSG